MKRLLLACLPGIVMAACATDVTPREAKAVRAEPYTEYPISADRYRIDYRIEDGGPRRAYDLALRRAAQITLEEGYPAFEIVGGDSVTNASARPTATSTAERTLSPSRDCGLIGCPKPAVPLEAAEPDAIKTNQSPSRVVSLEILLTRDGPNGSDRRYDAAEVVNAAGVHSRG